jgi:hypothetical protein
VFEWLRTSLTIFALNRTWRAGYAGTVDPAIQQSLRALISGYSGINDALFFLFDGAFLLGTLCYGLALLGCDGFDRKIGLLFLFWFAVSLPALIDAVRGVDLLSTGFAWVGFYFIPAARAIVGLWLWQKSKLLGEGVRRSSVG